MDWLEWFLKNKWVKTNILSPPSPPLIPPPHTHTYFSDFHWHIQCHYMLSFSNPPQYCPVNNIALSSVCKKKMHITLLSSWTLTTCTVLDQCAGCCCCFWHAAAAACCLGKLKWCWWRSKMSNAAVVISRHCTPSPLPLHYSSTIHPHGC